MTDLLPCPFCGGKAEIGEVVDYENTFCVQCCRCLAKSQYVHESNKCIAIEAWNQRAPICPKCNDKGKIRIERKDYIEDITCPLCLGLMPKVKNYTKREGEGNVKTAPLFEV